MKYTDFTNDIDKMKDFHEMSKCDFLKFYSYLTEQEYILTQYAVLEDNNQHGKAFLLLCQYFKLYTYVEKLKHINSLHDLYGSLTLPLQQMRNEIWNNIRKKYYTELLGYSENEYMTDIDS